LDEIRTVVGRAKQGDATVVHRLRELLAEHPAVWMRYGDLAAQAEMAWANLAAGPDFHLRECLLLRAEALRQELGGAAPSLVEKLLIERVVACWLQVHYFDATEAQSLNTDGKPRLAALRAKRQELAHRMYLTSLAALTTLRRLLPGATAKMPPAQGHDAAPAGRNGHPRNGHAADLPPGIQDRLGGICGEVHSANTKRPRAKELCPA
jgi:hypothetical protein